jgi:hypothetical protein
MAAWRFLTTSTLCAAKAALARRCGCRAGRVNYRPWLEGDALRQMGGSATKSG